MQVDLSLDFSKLAENPLLKSNLIANPILPAVKLNQNVLTAARNAWEEHAKSEYYGVMISRRLHGLLVDLNAPMDLQEFVLNIILQEQQHCNLCSQAAKSLGSNQILAFDLKRLQQKPALNISQEEELMQLILGSFCVSEAKVI